MCIRLFSRLQWKQLSEHQLPEMKRVPLEPLCLHVKSTLPERKVTETLAQALTPPDPVVVQHALDLLSRRQLITGEEQLSALGQHISRIPLDPALGVLMHPDSALHWLCNSAARTTDQNPINLFGIVFMGWHC